MARKYRLLPTQETERDMISNRQIRSVIRWLCMGKLYSCIILRQPLLLTDIF